MGQSLGTDVMLATGSKYGVGVVETKRGERESKEVVGFLSPCTPGSFLSTGQNQKNQNQISFIWKGYFSIFNPAVLQRET